jgi:phosphatidylinositol glycan class N
MTSTFYVLRNTEGEARGKKLVTLFVLQVDNFSDFDETNLIPICHPFTELFNSNYHLDNGLVCEEFASETGSSNIKPVGWLDRTWLVVFENVMQKNRFLYRLVLSSVLPFFNRVEGHTKYSKILTYFLGFGPCFVILSISVEGLFFVAYSVTLIAWIRVEKIIRQGTRPLRVHNGRAERSLSQTPSTIYQFHLDDLRIALFFLFFVQVGFFGTGK